MKYFVTQKLGPKQSLTKEGFLLCADSPFARTGEMIYGPHEVPIDAGPDGLVHIWRDAAEVFHSDCIDSFNGKPIVKGHPAGDVTPDNWRDVSVGVTMNVRRGEGADSDLLLADLLIQNKDEIQAVRSGLRELSAGYDADYLQEVPGKGHQINIRGNHVALVENGRCGIRCAIGDVQTVKENNMTWLEKLKAAFAAKDQTAFDAALTEAPKDNSTVVHVHAAAADAALASRTRDEEEEEEERKKKEKEKDSKTRDAVVDAVFSDKRMTDMQADVKAIKDAVLDEKKSDEENKKIEGSLEEEAPPGTGDKAKKARDSSYLADSWQEAVSLAEVISPGVQIPTFDKALAPAKTFDALCAFRKTALDLGYSRPELRSFMDSVLGGKKVSEFTCDALRTVFRSVGNFAKSVNNATARHAVVRDEAKPKAQTLADLNKQNAEYYKNAAQLQ